MSLELWLAFCATEAVLCFTPGPAVLLIVSIALGRGARPSIGAMFGIVAANTLYFALSATGVAATLAASRELFLVLKWGGAAYLIWIGARMLLAPGNTATSAEPVVLMRTFLKGFVVQGANPKALVFFMALLPQFIDPTGAIATQLVILGATSALIELIALSTYALVAIRTGEIAGRRVADWLERAGGALLIAAGARLAAARRE